MEKDISSLEHTRWRCQYHVVFAPKYRRLAIYGEIKADVGQILRKLEKPVKPEEEEEVEGGKVKVLRSGKKKPRIEDFIKHIKNHNYD